MSRPSLLERYYVEPAAAYVRGADPGLDTGSNESTLQAGIDRGMRLHRFKRARVLPRVRKVIGILHGLCPGGLLDIGTGRGAFLWPMLEAFPQLPVTCVDRDESRARQLDTVSRGGLDRLRALHMDATHLELDERSFDVVTALEVLEHIDGVADAIAELVRVAKRFVIVTVPSRSDDNPEHVHLLTDELLQSYFRAAGAERIETSYVLNHMVSVVKVP